MFGYIGPEKSELKVKELSLYQAYYCGLCKTIGSRYSQGSRLTLSYDCAFLAILLSGLNGCAGCDEHRCAYKPFSAKRPMLKPSPYLDFAADLNVLLSYYKCKDDWIDEKRLRGALGSFALSASGKKAAKYLPEMDKSVFKGLDALMQIEKQGCKELDEPADAFAAMMRDCINCAPVDETQKRTLRILMYHLGKWIYLMDAWDDREKDKKSGSFNPFLSSGAGEERAGFLLNASLNEAIKAYELLDIVSAKGILDNIFYEGCVNRTKAMLKAGGKHEQ